jgi:hypothetical protein
MGAARKLPKSENSPTVAGRGAIANTYELFDRQQIRVQLTSRREGIDIIMLHM